MQTENAAPDIVSTVGTTTLELSGAERAGIYRWLSGLFAQEPTFATLRVYKAADGMTLLDELSAIEALAPAAEAIRTRVSGAPHRDLKTISLDLSGEFARLFLGVGGRRSAPPYQSFYAGADGRLMQQTAGAMQDELQKIDARLTKSFAELPDHISVQLAVMSELALTASPAKQVDYLEHRLLDWIGAFRDRCHAAAPESFYTVAAGALVDFVRADAASLSA
ncbi:TorD/DmsD family molecular chaperone [Hoeflea prorocentri]|uniref:Molecular chaperone TorD family protein n=1 Tax=Hoeflea prorocentri TaxID=1922333 RepID=A0A9X3ZJ90_9HYPH|nr:molecular chaperone TorD family protein [Hoeflea prorocentri]MCY6382798.1 molecular chaperone TorD family protein [Hoeflea prorocentri]MDA5400598.1 molecular chaperone TorD family protein [Hoeflea prorocentri]